MKPMALATLLLVLLVGTAPALADGNGRGGNNGGNGHGDNGGNGHGGNNGGNGHGGYNGGRGQGGYNGGHGHRGYNYGHGGGYYYPARAYRGGYYSPYYYGYPQHRNNNNSNNGAAYALGGLVVGSLLTNAYFNNRVSQPVYVEQTTYQVPSRVVVQQTVPQGRRLLKDLNGNCYERTTDAAGNELRTELPPSECNW